MREPQRLAKALRRGRVVFQAQVELAGDGVEEVVRFETLALRDGGEGVEAGLRAMDIGDGDRAIQRDDALRNQVTTDPHSPAHYRTIVPIRDLDAWYKAFNIQPGDKLYIAPEDRVHIW